MTIFLKNVQTTYFIDYQFSRHQFFHCNKLSTNIVSKSIVFGNNINNTNRNSNTNRDWVSISRFHLVIFLIIIQTLYSSDNEQVNQATIYEWELCQDLAFYCFVKEEDEDGVELQ